MRPSLRWKIMAPFMLVHVLLEDWGVVLAMGSLWCLFNALDYWVLSRG